MFKKSIKHAFVFALPLFLASCFVGEAPMIPDGQAIIFGSDPIAFCADGECHPGVPVADAYEIADPDQPAGQKTMRMRFEPLWGDASGGSIFVVEMTIGGEAGVTYFAGRRTPDEPGRIDLQMPDCSRYDDAARARFNLKRADSYSCSAPDLETLKAAWLALYSEDFERPDFWRE